MRVLGPGEVVVLDIRAGVFQLDRALSTNTTTVRASAEVAVAAARGVSYFEPLASCAGMGMGRVAVAAAVAVAVPAAAVGLGPPGRRAQVDGDHKLRLSVPAKRPALSTPG